MNKALTVEQMRDEVEKIMAEHRGYEDGRKYDMNKALTNEQVKQALDEAIAYNAGLTDGKEYKLSEPREPRFEDDFFNEPSDDEPYEQHEWQPTTLEDIAITKAHAFAQEYNPSTGRVDDKPNYHALKEGYMAGFLEGFAHRLTHNTGE